MLVTNDAQLAARVRHLTTQARLPDRGYLHDEIGYNYRLTNVAAALGVAQLGRLDSFVEAKRRVASRYNEAFGQTALTLPPSRFGESSTYWLYSVLVPAESGLDGRDALQDFLLERGIESRALWRPLHLQPPLAHSVVLGGEVGSTIFQRGLSLPCSTELGEADQDHVIAAVLSWLDQISD